MKAINDHSKAYILHTILCNDRLKLYEEYIRLAQESGYEVSGLEYYYEHKDDGGKHFVLRHDVELPGKDTRKLFETELKLGITSTYYFRRCSFDRELIREMHQNGFEVGFHYETIAEYIKDTKCPEPSAIDMDECRQRLKDEIKWFENEVGFKTSSCASHGHLINTKWSCPNNLLFEDTDAAEYGVLFEAYNKTLYEKYITCHIMDRSPLMNYGFAYKDKNQVKAITDNERVIVFLAHPNNWYASPAKQVRQLVAYCFGKARFSSERTFKRI